MANLSLNIRSTLEKLDAPNAVSVMEDMIRACDNNNNNNNNDSDSDNNGGSGCAALAGLSREQLVQKLNVVSDNQLHVILKRQGII